MRLKNTKRNPLDLSFELEYFLKINFIYYIYKQTE